MNADYWLYKNTFEAIRQNVS